MSDPRAALRDIFGFDDFRPGQEEAVHGALAGRDVLVVMPTGAGKSLCYQLPALLREDLAIVVSPLVSLMQDQVEALARRAPGRVALVNSQQDGEANERVLARAAAGELALLYVAPERFASPGFLEALREVPIGLFVVDEAHCVSQWGHDFRPDYFRLADAARWLGAKAIVASTATATPEVAADIVRRLDLRDPVRVATGFDRPGLTFAARCCAGAVEVEGRLLGALEDPASRPAIVYAGTRRRTDELASALRRELGCAVLPYHAGLSAPVRADTQRRFLAGEVDVVVATNAFGMGVDKPDVRSVIHVSAPPSLEAWYQEAGRAGRDGRPARALLLAEPRDKALHVHFIRRSEVSDADLDRIAQGVVGAASGGRVDVAAAQLDRDEDRVRAIVGHLVRAGVLQPSPAPVGRVRGRVLAPYDERARTACRASAAEGVRSRWRQYRAIWAFLEEDGCRRAAVLRHFGDRMAPAPRVPCCDACAPDVVPGALAGTVLGGRGSGGRAGTGDSRGARRGGARRAVVAASFDPAALDAAILSVVGEARPSVGRTRAVEILRGGRSKAIAQHGYDALPEYGAFAGMSASEVLERVDELLGCGRLASTGGRFPKLEAVAGEPRSAAA
ncbi:MAG: RecQ family ATP-dependent DNA helicase [Solirubrobacteraceae bacterium]|nr:RecQ family ATP-dependent DNA helicase [Solirubrobacteraceae bacterium]